ncbi:hypothetical protein DGM93_21755 [Xanthomonas phaseoli pv. phaseoli]|nr:hypothetical protein DGM93_21755 [Xanthomonas phaseoli pv. phaseoli]
MGNGEWGMGNGEWGSGKREAGSGKREAGSGKREAQEHPGAWRAMQLGGCAGGRQHALAMPMHCARPARGNYSRFGDFRSLRADL